MFPFFIRLGGAKRLGSEKQSPESDTDSMAEYGEGDTGIYYISRINCINFIVFMFYIQNVHFYIIYSPFAKYLIIALKITNFHIVCLHLVYNSNLV